MKLNYFICFLLLVNVLQTYAQPPAYIDSLERLLKNEKDVKEKVKLLNQIAQSYFYSDPQKTIEYNQKAIHLIPKDYYYGLGQVYTTMGSIHGHINELSKSLFYLDSAVVFYTKADSLHKLADVYGNIGIAYFFMSSYKKGTEYLYKSIAINEKFGNIRGVAYNFSSLAAMHFEQKEFEAAIKTGKKVLKQYPFANEPIFTANTSLNIGLAYSNLHQLDSALLYYNQALGHFRKKNYLGGIAKIHIEKSELYLNHQQLDSAKWYIYKAFELEEAITDQYHRLNMNITLATIYLYEKKYSQSIDLYNTVRKAAHAAPNKTIEKVALKGLIDNYKALEHYKKVAEYLEAYTILKDTILNTEKQQQIKELDIKYETEKKEQEIALLAKERDIQALSALRNQQWAYSAFIILILVLLISFLLLRQNKLRTAQQTAQLKHRLLRNQMNPHFIFNALTAIQSYVYDNNPKEAGLYLSSFAKLVRAILENSRKEYITLEKEIQWLENYLKLQLLRFDHQFEYQIDVDSLLDIHGLLIPPMLTQPFIENALEHGLKNIDYKGMITIRFISDKEQQLKINIIDNGIGYKATAKDSSTSTHHSLATTITKERLSFLNKKQATDIDFMIEPSEPSGTIVSFLIPLNYI